MAAFRPNGSRQPAAGSGNLHQKLVTLIHGALTDTGGNQKLVTIDRRTIEKVSKLTDKVVKLCQHPRMNIKNSPPFILDILPDTLNHLKQIQSHYDDRMQQLVSNEYFVCFIDNLLNKCRKCKKVWGFISELANHSQIERV
jgi:E3 ubiquitin-protein ligase CBL